MIAGVYTGLEQGSELTTDDTATGDECIACRRRFSNRYWIGSRGPYCASCLPKQDFWRKEDHT